jgi:hypothetical protein
MSRIIEIFGLDEFLVLHFSSNRLRWRRLFIQNLKVVIGIHAISSCLMFGVWVVGGRQRCRHPPSLPYPLTPGHPEAMMQRYAGIGVHLLLEVACVFQVLYGIVPRVPVRFLNL